MDDHQELLHNLIVSSLASKMQGRLPLVVGQRRRLAVLALQEQIYRERES